VSTDFFMNAFTSWKL